MFVPFADEETVSMCFEKKFSIVEISGHSTISLISSMEFILVTVFSIGCTFSDVSDVISENKFS
jgi:hypothetical protein